MNSIRSHVFVYAIIFSLGILYTSCNVESQPRDIIEDRPVDLVYPLLDAANSRWFYFASASRPFGMVNLNPDTQIDGAWGSGYKYNTDTIKGFSHIHAWQMSGVSVMPLTLTAEPTEQVDDYYSQFDHDQETVEVGYHAVQLNRYQTQVELTSTTRVGFHKYTFPKDAQGGVVFKLEGKLGPTDMMDGTLTQVDEYTVSGFMNNAPTRRRPKKLGVYFVAKFDTPIKELISGEGQNILVAFDENATEVKMKLALSYTSTDNAVLNMAKELSHWDFDKVVEDSQEEWNQLLRRVEISDENPEQQRRFYADLWHSLQGRRIISDVNGAYPDNTGQRFRIGQLPTGSDGTPKFNHYNSDSFWGAQWTLNTLWGLLYPEVYDEFVQSMYQYYLDGGIVPRGPSGGNYTYVMTGASSTPFIVSAYQKGISTFDPEEMYKALRKNHMSQGIMAKAGYEHNTHLGGGLDHYMDQGHVPYPIPEGKFGAHQDGASLTLEYAYQDWTLAQMALSLGKEDDYQYFLQRSSNYKNVYDDQSGWIRPKSIDGKWKTPFDPYEYEHGFNESNGAQSTWFVPHDLPGLGALMGGNEAAVAKLDEQFRAAQKKGFTSGTSHERGEDPTRARVPINYGNQPSMQTAFVFNHLGRPDLTQYWASEVTKVAFGALSPQSGYNGDEDQGLMGSLAVILKLGLFQMNGGTEKNPSYEFSGPLFAEANLRLPNGNHLQITRQGEGPYIEEVSFNDDVLTSLEIRHDDIMKGGILSFKMNTEKQ